MLLYVLNACGLFIRPVPLDYLLSYRCYCSGMCVLLSEVLWPLWPMQHPCHAVQERSCRVCNTYHSPHCPCNLHHTGVGK